MCYRYELARLVSVSAFEAVFGYVSTEILLPVLHPNRTSRPYFVNFPGIRHFDRQLAFSGRLPGVHVEKGAKQARTKVKA